MDLATLSACITANPSLQAISFDRLLQFLALVTAIRSDIALVQPSDHSPAATPEVLPHSAQVFLSHACGFSIDTVIQCWSAFKHLAWHSDETCALLRASPSTFHVYGIPHGFTARTLYPPTQHCPVPSCSRTLKGMRCKRMMRAQQRQCVLYTVSDGPLPIYTVHLSCEACEINYHYNFKVFKGERTYYGGIPDIIQVSEHQFLERQVIEMWMSLMDHWTSATSCADFYNVSMAKGNEPPPDWSFGFMLSSEHVWSGFYLHCLLEDAVERHECLIMNHTGDQKDRFNELVQARNQRMRIEGQPEITHFCDKCTRWFRGPNGHVNSKCSVVVTDGVCIGHPCCGSHNCKTPLKNNRDRFCPIHANLEHLCSIVGCDLPVVSGRLTCADPLHQALSQLATIDNDDDEFEIDPTGRVADAALHTSAQPATTHKKLRTKFTRSRTHNEQLAVAPCGMILGRDTMFGAEGVASVAEFLKRTFRMEAIKPDHIFFDNNCSLAQHVKLDPYFNNIGLSVDVFHFKCKHKETHTFCQENCNPAAFPELISDDGQGWYFNSSIAEQTNVWIGGYHAVGARRSLRLEMLVDKYDFFLDQMILRRNRMTRAKLDAQGARPSNWPV
ncbi:hypothetical protein L210DRAFT_3392409 [Boletus edulis BED1]|uniref:CxC6 like cysteine cluster associated with KDZ domain-containing protein n=1 Tax=Boletus edulis BED1 TaxID=1328754 RepID=A0AAD4C1S4_BOLED|nr:hypothetical protein L210DRAFT_3392409 [Boletus edulis BED1]